MTEQRPGVRWGGTSEVAEGDRHAGPEPHVRSFHDVAPRGSLERPCEVDSGVGGVTATAVAARLEALARTRQVIVITHLPQVAALAESHYRLVKGVDADGRATTRIDAVEGDDLVDELCRMLGAAPTDDGARTHARELLARRGADSPRRRSRRPARHST